MPVTEIEKDPEALTMTVTAEFAAPRERVWRLYSEGEQLQRWWGPPGWPATFVRHELEPGGGSFYYMQGPDGDRSYGVWSVVSVDAPRAFAIDDAFADADGTPNDQIGWSRMTFDLAAGADGTTVTMATRFASTEQMETQLGMGMEDGIRQAMDQIDGILDADDSGSKDSASEGDA